MPPIASAMQQKGPARRRAGLAVWLAPLAVMGVVAATVGVGERAPQKPPMASKLVVAHDPAGDTSDFMQSVALSHLAPARPFVEEPAPKPVAERDAKPKATAAAKPTSKRVEVAVLPPPRPAPAAAPEPAAPATPASESSFTRKTFGFDLPRLPDVAEIAPSPKEIGEKAADLARRVGASIKKIF